MNFKMRHFWIVQTLCIRIIVICLKLFIKIIKALSIYPLKSNMDLSVSILCFLMMASFAFSDSGSEWSYNAWKWLCREAAKGSSNEDIALTISSELTIAYYSEARFVIFVADEGVENGFDLDPDNVDYGNLLFTKGSLCSKDMLAIYVASPLCGQCDIDTVYDHEVLENYLTYALAGTVFENICKKSHFILTLIFFSK